MRIFLRCLVSLLVVAAMGLGEAAEVRVTLFDDAGGTTAKGLKALGVECKLAAPGDYTSGAVSLFDSQVAVWGMDVDQNALNMAPERLQAFLRSGGVLLCMRMNQEPRWLADPRTDLSGLKMDKAYAIGEVLKPEHPVFNVPRKFAKSDLAKVHGGSIYRGLYELPQGAVPLVSSGDEQGWDKTVAASKGEHYGLVEVPVGKGRVIFCQMIPDYGYISDDKGQAGTSSAFLGNLMAYACSVAPNWPAPRGRVVPANFVSEFSDILRAPKAVGSLPLGDEAWKITSKGPFGCKTDRRGVMTMSHADEPAAAGSFVEATRTVTLPAGGAYLRFYNSDDYCGGNEPKLVGDKRVSTRENRLKDVRFKQVLVNGKVVWEEDVLGMNPNPATRRFVMVEMPGAGSVTTPTSATITLRVENRSATTADFPFATDVYWAGVDVLPGIVRVPVAEGQGTVKTKFAGQKGRYAVLVRALDEHTGQGKLAVAVDGKALGTAQLTADDYGWYWINFGQADLKPGSVVSVQATPEGGEACVMQSVALVPTGLLAGKATVADGATGSPLYKPTKAPARATFPVLVAGPEDYKASGEVVSGGMPFAYGAVKAEGNIRLLNDQGREVPLQTRVLAKWPDGSFKWVLFSFPTAPGEVRCEYGTQVKRAPVEGLGVTVKETADSIAINTGVLQATVSKRGGGLLDGLQYGRQILPLTGDAWALWVTAEDGTVYSSAGETVSRCEVVEAGPMRAVVRRVGRLKAVQGGRDFLEYDLTEEFYANSGVVRVQPVLTHKEASAEEKLSRVRFLLTMGAQAICMDGQRVEKGGLWQKDDQTAEFEGRFEGKQVTSDKKRFAGQVRLVGKGVTMDLVPRWFWQMYPKSVAATPGGIDLSLVAAEKEKPFVLHQGQAIWNDFALVFGDETGEPREGEFDAVASPAVATAEPGYVASTLALGEFAAADEALFPEYEQSVENVYKGYLSKREARREYGVENFGDDTFEWGYGPSYTFWSNQEYDHHYGMLMQFLRSGDYRWWEIADEGARHYRDVDCYHWAPGREYLLGAPHHHNAQHQVEKGWVADHTVAGAHNSHSWVEGVIAYYFMTGDPRSYEVYNAMGDWYCYTVANNQYGAGGQERGPGWTLVALSALYNATYDEKYREAGSKVIDWVRSVQDPVRGVISVPISEQPSYEGGTAFMHGIVARGAGRWYEATGDPRAKEALLGIADWLTTEAMGPNALFYYKQAPTQKHGYSVSEWQCFTALSYAARYGDQQWYGPLTEEHYNQGRAGTRSIAWAPQSLGHLLPYFTPIRVRLVTPQAVLSPDQPAEIKLQVVNTTDKALAVEVKGLAVPTGLTLEAPVKVTIEPAKVTELACRLSAKKGTEASGEVRLEIKAGEARREYAIPVTVVAKLVQVQKGAGEGKTQAPFVLMKMEPPVAGVVRDATFTGNPRQPGERAGWVEWRVNVPADGVYYFGAECWWPDDKGNSFFLQVDDGAEAVFGNDGVMGRWHWVRHAAGVRMAAGQHVVRLVNREDGGQVRGIVVTNVEGRLGN